MYRITTKRFIALRDETSVIFEEPNSEAARKLGLIFYYPYTKAKKNTKAIKAGGAYYDKYLNIRGEKIENGEIPKDDAEGTIFSLFYLYFCDYNMYFCAIFISWFLFFKFRLH